MEGQLACSPCTLDGLLSLPSPDIELLALGLPDLSPQLRVPHAACPMQPSPGQQTPDMASLDFPISEEEMQWLVALADGVAPASAGQSTPLAGAPAAAAAAEAASTSTAVTAPLQQTQNVLLDDMLVLGGAFAGMAMSQAQAAAGAAEFGNNVAWVADAAAASAGLVMPIPGDRSLLQELRLWNGEIQSAASTAQPGSLHSSGTSSRGQRSGRPRRSTHASLKRRGRQPAIKSAFQRDIELFTLRVQEEEAARQCSAAPAQPAQPMQQQLQQPQPDLPTCAAEHQQHSSGAAMPAVSAVAAAVLPHQSLTALLASCLGVQKSPSASTQASGPCAVDIAPRPATNSTAPAASTAAAPAEDARVPGGIEVPIQVVEYHLRDWSQSHDMGLKLEQGSASNNQLGFVSQGARKGRA